ncbi:MAG TPA: response regulator transcription factor [Candidatus Binataceae bacterium]|nr:response regulator transcription factor [Candidatus Binataceae bacterium]
MARPQILIVEDEAQLRASLERGLAEEDFTVAATGDAPGAAALIAARTFDAIVLDRRLPGTDGLTLLRDLRAAGNRTPVLILTARGALDDRVTGLEAGADDYLVKPFAFTELIARIRALIRRASIRGPAMLKVADLEFDPVRRRASRGGRELALSPKEAMLLELLMRHAGQTVTRAMMIEVVWDSAYNDLTNLIEVFVNRLRQKIDSGDGESPIVTVRGAGYSLRAD